MDLFHTGCRVVNPADPRKSAVVPRLMVDTGAESTWVEGRLLEKLGIEPRKKDLQFMMANRQVITRSMGYAILKVEKAETVDEVVFAEKGDLLLLGARALEGLNLRVDPRAKKLVAAGPIVTAVAVPPHFAKLVQVPLRTPKIRRKSPKKNAARRRVSLKLK